MLLLIDNYDSFTYNLVHYLGELGADVVVKRNDALGVNEAMAMAPEAILLSPGPCDPAQAGICLELTPRRSGCTGAFDGRLSGPSGDWRNVWWQGGALS